MTVERTIRWGIIGAGKIAQSFVRDFPLLHNAVLVAIAASNKERAVAFAATHNIGLAYTYEELYSSSEVDAVYISTTHNFHFEQVKQCLLHGKAVLCEKPITINDTECKQLVELSKANKVFLMEAMWSYFLPAVIKAQQWLAEGRIGALKAIQADFSFAVEKNLTGRMYNPQLAGGALLDLGVYNVALSTFFMQRKPGSITATGILTETGVDASTAMLLHYGDVVATLFTSMQTRMTNKLCLFGEKGYIELPEFWRAKSAILYDSEFNAAENFEDGRTAHGFVYEMQHATDMILNDAVESNIMPHQTSIDIQEIMTEVRRQIGLQYPMESKT
jgi:predicted dehydrogenase